MSPVEATEGTGIVVFDEMVGVGPEDQRWPLTRAPAIDPSYPLTSAFDDAQEPWITLCESRKDARKRDVLEYLESWCKLRFPGQPTDRDLSLVALARLVDSVVVGAAVRDDLISLLADRDAVSALHWLRDQRLETIEMLERLAATYVELDRREDASRVIDLLAERDPDAAMATQCRRLRRHMRIAPLNERSALQQQLLELRRQDTTCGRLAATIDGTSRTVASATVSVAWPQTLTSFDASWQIAMQANQARPKAGSDEIMTNALEHAARYSGCEPDRLGNIRLLAAAVRSTDNHPASLDGRLDVLADLGPLECKQYVSASP